MDDPLELNRRHWDEYARLHATQSSELYDIDGFLAGRSTLRAIDRQEVGDVAGQRLLHLQCHFGMDTLSWARAGAKVTGLDFSGEAIARARDLAQRVGLEASFVEADALDPPVDLHGHFDVVYTSYGAVGWLPDLDRWATAVHALLRPGGRFHLIDGHPLSDSLAYDGNGAPTIVEPYFRSQPWHGEEEGTYALPHAAVENKESYFWIHPLADMFGALLRVGLVLRGYREFPYTYYPANDAFRRREDGYWDPPAGAPALPLMIALRAERPERPERR